MKEEKSTSRVFHGKIDFTIHPRLTNTHTRGGIFFANFSSSFVFHFHELKSSSSCPKPGNDKTTDETQTNGTDVKANGTGLDSHTSETSQKYSQILGDLHTNSTTQHTRSSSHHQFKSRAYNNKENFYNQRNGGRPGVQRSWQRGGNYRTPLFNGKDRRSDENDKPLGDSKVDSTAEPIKFNEGELTFAGSTATT